MKVSKLIALLQKMPQDIDVEVNDNKGGRTFTIDGEDDVTHYIPNTDLWHDDVPLVIIQVNT
jgi:hypothetical protein